jgi:N-acetylneuraminic acid mutarotase
MSHSGAVSFLLSLALLSGCAPSADRDPTGPDGVNAATATAAASNAWAVKRSLSPWRFGSAVAAVGGKLYLVGGFRRVNGIARTDAYDIATNTWSEVAPLPSARSLLPGASVIDGKVYVASGRNAAGDFTRTLYVYNPTGNTWSRKADLPQTPCYSQAQGVISGKLYLFLGCTPSQASGGVFFRYDPATNSWTRRAAPPPASRSGGVGTAVGGKFYLVSPGGAMHAYDPAGNAWTARAGIGNIPSNSAPASLGGKLYLLGGHHIEFETDTVMVYDPAANKWSSRAHLPNKAEYGAAVGYNGRLYYVTGVEYMQSPCCFYGPSRLWVYMP